MALEVLSNCSSLPPLQLNVVSPYTQASLLRSNLLICHTGESSLGACSHATAWERLA